MNRRDFITGGALACVAGVAAGARASAPRVPQAKCEAQLNLALQWGAIPADDDFNAKLDYLEANGFAAVEIPTGKWLFEKADGFAKAMQGRKLFCATACGPSRFDYADKQKRDAEVASFLPQLEILGGLKSVGLIICPARAKPEIPLQDLRADFVENTGRRLAEKAAACGTAIVLEPLQRRETPFLRQVADGAKMAQEIGKGCKVMGDFWHMSKEEPSQFAAFLAAGDLLAHVHVASLVNRRIPGLDGAADDYRKGFTALKMMGYRGAVSMEAGWPVKGKDAAGKPIFPDRAGRRDLVAKMCALLRAQWEEA